MKPVRLSKHAQGYINSRGFTIDEVENAIGKPIWKPIVPGGSRFECSMEYAFDSDWNGKHYKTKRVRPIFEERALEIVVITVYTYYY